MTGQLLAVPVADVALDSSIAWVGAVMVIAGVAALSAWATVRLRRARRERLDNDRK